jgi:hypothetical protein
MCIYCHRKCKFAKFAPTDRLPSSSHKFFGVSKQKIIISQNQQKNCYRQKDCAPNMRVVHSAIFGWSMARWATHTRYIIIISEKCILCCRKQHYHQLDFTAFFDRGRERERTRDEERFSGFNPFRPQIHHRLHNCKMLGMSDFIMVFNAQLVLRILCILKR